MGRAKRPREDMVRKNCGAVYGGSRDNLISYMEPEQDVDTHQRPKRIKSSKKTGLIRSSKRTEFRKSLKKTVKIVYPSYGHSSADDNAEMYCRKLTQYFGKPV